jgi:hypothetical protein
MDGLQLQQRLRLDGHEVPYHHPPRERERRRPRSSHERRGAGIPLEAVHADVLLATIEAAGRRMAAGG